MPGNPRARALETEGALERFLRAEVEARPTRAVLVARQDGTLRGEAIPPKPTSAVIVVRDLELPAPEGRGVPELPPPEWGDVARDVIQRMLVARHKPVTIARELERLKIRTPTGGRRWSAARVKALAAEPV